MPDPLISICHHHQFSCNLQVVYWISSSHRGKVNSFFLAPAALWFYMWKTIQRRKLWFWSTKEHSCGFGSVFSSRSFSWEGTKRQSVFHSREWWCHYLFGSFFQRTIAEKKHQTVYKLSFLLRAAWDTICVSLRHSSQWELILSKHALTYLWYCFNFVFKFNMWLRNLWFAKLSSAYYTCIAGCQGACKLPGLLPAWDCENKRKCYLATQTLSW